MAWHRTVLGRENKMTLGDECAAQGRLKSSGLCPYQELWAGSPLLPRSWTRKVLTLGSYLACRPAPSWLISLAVPGKEDPEQKEVASSSLALQDCLPHPMMFFSSAWPRLQKAAVRCRSSEAAPPHGFGLQEWSKTPTETTGVIDSCWRGSSAFTRPATHQSFPPTPRDLPSDCEQGKKPCHASVTCTCPLTCSSWFAGQIPGSWFALTPHSSSCWLGAQDPHSSAPLLSNGLDGCVHKSNLVLEIG